jgi:hypothetical protein
MVMTKRYKTYERYAIVWGVKAPEVVSPNEKFVLLALNEHADADGANCYPSRATLASETGLKSETISRLIKSLKAKGLIEVKKRFRDGAQTSNQYKLLYDAMAFNPCDLESPPLSSEITPPVTQNHTPCDLESPPPVTQDHTDQIHSDHTQLPNPSTREEENFSEKPTTDKPLVGEKDFLTPPVSIQTSGQDQKTPRAAAVKTTPLKLSKELVSGLCDWARFYEQRKSHLEGTDYYRQRSGLKVVEGTVLKPYRERLEKAMTPWSSPEDLAQAIAEVTELIQQHIDELGLNTPRPLNLPSQDEVNALFESLAVEYQKDPAKARKLAGSHWNKFVDWKRQNAKIRA